MRNFTIHELERFSGIKAHTLRVWEQRYSFLQPVRSAGNLRSYSLDEFKKILNISLLKKDGYRISFLANHSIEDLDQKLKKISTEYIKWQRSVNDITTSMYSGNPESIDNILDEMLVSYPIEVVTEQIIAPFLNITGLFWIGNKVSEEHFAVTAIRKKLMYAIQSCTITGKRDKTILLFLPDNKQLDLGLLYANYHLRRSGCKVLYMGSDVTHNNLKSILQVTPVNYIFTYLPQHHPYSPDELLLNMRVIAPGSKLVIGNYHKKNADSTIHEDLLQIDFIKALDFLSTSA